MAIDLDIVGNIIKMHNKGVCHSGIARTLGVSYYKIVYVLRKNGLTNTHKRLTEEDAKYIKEKFRMLPITEIANDIGCSKAVILRFLRKENLIVKRMYFVWTTQRKTRLISLYSQGLQYIEIAKHFGVSRLSISSKLYSLRKNNELQLRRCGRNKNTNT